MSIGNCVTSIGYRAFGYNMKLTIITMGVSMEEIDSYAFYYCFQLKNIKFNGTKDQWKSILKTKYWNDSTGNYVIHCTDGDIAKS